MTAHMLVGEGFRRGAAHLARLGLVLDVWAYHTQLDDVYALASALPDLIVVVDHFGGPLAVGPHALDPAGTRADWVRAMQRLGTLPNVRVKLGGGGMPVLGFNFHHADMPPASAQLAAALVPYVEPCIGWFGVERCMFESNFPVDKGMFSYQVVWNAFKRIAADYSEAERAALFHDTAAATYCLTAL
jgi:predicted TIM-barrel fold metal-dependent hydrolase